MKSVFEVLFVVSMFAPPAAVIAGAALLFVRAAADPRPQAGPIELGGHALAGGQHGN